MKEEAEAPPDLEGLLAEIASRKYEAQLKEWSVALERLRARVGEAGVEAQAEFGVQAQALRTRVAELQSQLDALQKAGGDATHEMLEGIHAAWAELKQAFESAAAKFE
jgi:capsule polysaccharide export protein KpsE/RkpR